MAINANHPFEELNGIRCAVVEKNCNPARVAFLKYILEGNGFDVVVASSPPPKAAPAAKTPAAAAEQPAAEPAPEVVPAAPPPAESFTVGVTDVTFNVINAIYGRLLRSPEGNVVTMAYWQQKEDQSRDDIPYYARG